MTNYNAVQIIVYGKVQGVGFRRTTQHLAETMLITGTIENKSDGSVKIIAQGKNINKFIGKIKQSPTPYGKVSNIDIKNITTDNYHYFQIKY